MINRSKWPTYQIEQYAKWMFLAMWPSLKWEDVPELTRELYRHILVSVQMPFDAQDVRDRIAHEVLHSQGYGPYARTPEETADRIIAILKGGQ